MQLLVERACLKGKGLPATAASSNGAVSMPDGTASGNLIELTAEIVSAYVSNNTVAAGEIPGLINQVHAALARVSGRPAEGSSEPLRPAVSVKKSITPEYIVCLEDGKKFKSLKRHLRTRAVSREMGSECRLPNGCAKLRRGPLTARETNGAWATAASACKVTPGRLPGV